MPISNITVIKNEELEALRKKAFDLMTAIDALSPTSDPKAEAPAPTTRRGRRRDTGEIVGGAAGPMLLRTDGVTQSPVLL